MYEDFVDEEYILLLNNILDTIRYEANYNINLKETFFENKVTNEIKEVSVIVDKLKVLFGTDYIVRENLTVNVLSVGHDWGEHYDAHDFIKIRDLSKKLKDGDPYTTLEDSYYGIVLYLNSPEQGGDLVYTKQGISYSPKAGNLVVHSSEEHCSHRVDQVLGGHRYSYSNHLAVPLNIPKYYSAAL